MAFVQEKMIMKYEVGNSSSLPMALQSSRVTLQEATVMEQMRHTLHQCQPWLVTSLGARGMGKVDFNITYLDKNREFEAKRKFYLSLAWVALCAFPLFTGLTFLVFKS